MDNKLNWRDFVITVVTSTMRQEMSDHILKNFLRQDYHPKELIILLNKKELNAGQWKERTANYNNIRVFQLDEKKTLGECLNFGGQQALYDVIAKFDDDDYYSPAYLTNMVGQLKKKNIDVIGKSSIFVYFKTEKKLSLFRRSKSPFYIRNERDLKRALAGGTLIFKKAVLKKVPFARLNKGEDLQFQKDCLQQGLSLFSSDPYDYVLFRYDPKHHQHSWNIDNQIFQRYCQLISVTESFEGLIQRPQTKRDAP
ncbi:glycosyltransferase [Sporolactobacillus laevolacticus]|uniref:Glycosyltransferase n=2 Tax=Sporolactobacillus laevolacticus TaxID=33018 RepID=V6IX02_9BACL|nr:glycosyltransferase [Sporolactobacillus laevolacticus]EST11873.1 glycosyltransferase [Sporolactobacillus laevolacticus DSM 442]